MRFACIQDCSVCPLACYRGGGAVQVGQNVQSSSPIPDILQESFKAEKIEKSEDLTASDSIIPDDEHAEEANNAIQEAQNLPVLADVQYSVETVQKRGLFNRFKKEK